MYEQYNFFIVEIFKYETMLNEKKFSLIIQKANAVEEMQQAQFLIVDLYYFFV